MKIRSFVAAAALGAIGLAACGSDGGYGAPAPAPTTASTIATISPSTAAASTRDSSLGPVLVDGKQLTLYGLTQDDNGMPTCLDACAAVWPPEAVNGATLPTGLDPAIFSVVTRPDGTHQLKAGKWPLYRFAGDAAPGDVNGQGSGGVWYVVTPTGGLHKS
jgi:predicted lipoprotein with Yx(FWY)xxD motif